MKEDPWKEKLRGLIGDFVKKEEGIKEVYLFVSCLWGGAGVASDFDLAVKGEEKSIRRLAEFLEESTFPFEVDVVGWEELPEGLREKIQKEGERWL